MSVTEQAGALGIKYSGIELRFAEVGSVTLSTALRAGSETAVYRTDHPEIVVKIFDLGCGNPEEVSYGPYVAYELEVANFEEIAPYRALRESVPKYYGASLDFERKFAYVGMEFLEGQDLQEWCDAAMKGGYTDEWVHEFRRVVFETLGILERFHDNNIVVIDFKPENVLRLSDGSVRFVDLGAFFTPRHVGKTKEYVYSATPDYAELLIDSSNVESGVALTEATDIFAAGVALFEMVTRESRLSIAPETADAILDEAEIYLFRDSQIKDVWKAYPHLQDILPLVMTQLRDRELLFAEFWHVLKGYLSVKIEDWESYSQTKKDELLIATGEDFIRGHLPTKLDWLAGLIARATVFRSLRIDTIAELTAMAGERISPEVYENLECYNIFVRYLQDLGQGDRFVESLNQWEVRRHEESGHWAISGRSCCRRLGDNAGFTFMEEAETDFDGQAYYHIAGDDAGGHAPVPLSDLAHSRVSWVL